MKSLFYTLLILAAFQFKSFAQSKERYIVASNVLNMRSGPGKENELIHTLEINDIVTLIEKLNNGWWLVNYEGTEGYVLGKLLSKDRFNDWDRKKYSTGETPDCENIIPEYDNKINNFLRINVGSQTDVVVKLMKKSNYGDDICIRIVFIRSSQSFDIKNIPEGNYYLKIAYGKDWRQKVVDNQCFGKFMSNAHYELGKEKLDYNIVQKGDYVTVPSFELSLDVIRTKSNKSNFNTNKISEAIFNN